MNNLRSLWDLKSGALRAGIKLHMGKVYEFLDLLVFHFNQGQLLFSLAMISIGYPTINKTLSIFSETLPIFSDFWFYLLNHSCNQMSDAA